MSGESLPKGQKMDDAPETLGETFARETELWDAGVTDIEPQPSFNRFDDTVFQNNPYHWEDRVLFKRNSVGEDETISEEQHQALLLAAKNGDRTAMSEVVQIHTGFVRTQVRKHQRNSPADPNDLFQSGVIGLMRAVEKYDPQLGAFLPYAKEWINSLLQKQTKKESEEIHIPAHNLKAINQYRTVHRELSHSLGREPNQAELAARLNMTALELDKFERETGISTTFISIEENGGGLDLDSEDATHDPDVAVDEQIRHELQHHLEQALTSLSPDEEKVLRLRYGIDEREYASQANEGNDRRFYLTHDQIATIMNVTKIAVRRIESRALAKMGLPSRSDALSTFTDRFEARGR